MRAKSNPQPLDALASDWGGDHGGQLGIKGMGWVFSISSQHSGNETNAALQSESAAALALAKARLLPWLMDLLQRCTIARTLRTLRITNHSGLESNLMNELGEPNMGNLYVRFDEGRESVGHWP